jgi:methyltransferase
VTPVLIVTFLVALQRLGELVIARRNTSRLLAAGAVEHGSLHYPLIVLLHAAWLVTLPLVVAADRWPDPFLLAFFIVLQALRVWVLLTLGERWTTRIITLEGAPPVRHGPYRFVRHPNYLIVALEFAALPLAFGAWLHALVFSALNTALLLLLRIPAENRAWASAPRR